MQSNVIVAMTTEEIYSVYLRSHKVTTDSRAITPGCLFFAFKGEHFDGNAFAPEALQQGAALCIIGDETYRCDDRCVVVEDVLLTLQQLATHHRNHLTIPVIGITGTNGKTTTKELVHTVLSRRYRTYATQGNYNNHLGVPLTLLSIPPDAEMAVVEMGANHPGEIADLCGIAQPNFGLITNVGRAHLEGFGSFEGVIDTKTALYRHLTACRGTAFVNAENEILMARATSDVLNTVTYGDCEGAWLRGHLVESNPYMKFYIEEGDNVYSIQTQLLGGYNFENAMAAAAVGHYFHVELWDIKEAIANYAPANNRSQCRDTGRNILFLDCYNANPSSMKVSIDNFESLPRDNKVAILGAMKELGTDSRQEHENIARRMVADEGITTLLVGAEFGFVEQEECYRRLRWFADVDAAAQYLTDNPPQGATILLKGSNSTRIWKLEELL